MLSARQECDRIRQGAEAPFPNSSETSSNWPPAEKNSLDQILVHYAEHGQLELETVECGQFNREPGPIELGNTMDFERFHCPKT